MRHTISRNLWQWNYWRKTSDIPWYTIIPSKRWTDFSQVGRGLRTRKWFVSFIHRFCSNRVKYHNQDINNSLLKQKFYPFCIVHRSLVSTMTDEQPASNSSNIDYETYFPKLSWKIILIIVFIPTIYVYTTTKNVNATMAVLLIVFILTFIELIPYLYIYLSNRSSKS